MIAHNRYRLHDDGNTAEIDSGSLAEEIDEALAQQSREPSGKIHVLHPGHTYSIANRDGGGVQIVQFVARGPRHSPKAGVLNQDLLRVLIDRVKLLDSEVPWSGNKEIIHHLRMAITLHEARAMVRDAEKRSLIPEHVALGDDGHFALSTVALDHG